MCGLIPWWARGIRASIPPWRRTDAREITSNRYSGCATARRPADEMSCAHTRTHTVDIVIGRRRCVIVWSGRTFCVCVCVCLRIYIYIWLSWVCACAFASHVLSVLFRNNKLYAQLLCVAHKSVCNGSRCTLLRTPSVVLNYAVICYCS